MSVDTDLERESFLQQVGENIRTQDNRCTASPLFVVQQKRRIYGMDGDYCENYEWVAEDDYEAVASAIERDGLDAREARGEEVSGWVKTFYVDLWDFVTVCFTEEGCKHYLAANGHNLNEPRIYVASAYRNREMITIREMLKEL